MNKFELMPAVPFATAFIAGLVASYYVASVPVILFLLLSVIGIVAEFFVFNSRKWRDIPLLFVFFMLGGLAMAYSKRQLVVSLPQNYTPLYATVIDVQRPTDRYFVAKVRVQTGSLAQKNIRLYVDKEAQQRIALGATYKLKGVFHEFENFSAQSNFNYKRWAQSNRLSAQLYVYQGGIQRTANRLEELPMHERVSVKSKIMRENLLKRLAEVGVDTHTFSLMAAMGFGERAYLQQETRAIFQRTGVAHLLALSGMHLGILYFFLSTLLFTRRTLHLWGNDARLILGNVLVIAAVWMYVMLVGMPASVVRAAIMVTIYQLMSLGNRERMSVNCLFITVVIMLTANPMQIWDVGFQLSFLAMLSIFLFHTKLHSLMPEKLLFRIPGLRWLWSAITISFAAQVLTAPLTIYYFGLFSLHFIIANIFAIPIVSLFLCSAMLLVLSLWLPAITTTSAWLVNNTAWLLTTILSRLAHYDAAVKDNISISPLQLFLLYAILTVFLLIIHQLWMMLQQRRKKITL